MEDVGIELRVLGLRELLIKGSEGMGFTVQQACLGFRELEISDCTECSSLGMSYVRFRELEISDCTECSSLGMSYVREMDSLRQQTSFSSS